MRLLAARNTVPKATGMARVRLFGSDRTKSSAGRHLLRSWMLQVRLIAGREVSYVGVSGFGLSLESTEIL